MSGIAGLYRLDGQPTEQASVQRMIERMAHRGPDGKKVWAEGAVGLGHGMLHTTPESLREELPLQNERGTLALTADARLDNREELIRQLDLRRPPASLTDSQLILAAYEAWGQTCVDHLLGAFAFALWDGPRQTLFCAKDHIGIRNLYFWHRPGCLFACATEIKALLCLPGVPEVLDEAQVGALLTREMPDAQRTLFKGVRRLQPGHTLTVTPQDLHLRPYWEPAPTTDPIPTDDEGCTRRFLELFTEAVRCRLRSAHPVGSELSGGLDSSFVTCMARDLLGADAAHPLPTISLTYNQFPGCDERAYIEAVVAQGGIAPHYEVVEEHGLFDLLDDLFDYADEGRTGGNHHLNWLTAEAARDAGLRVLLTGQDGDTTVYHGWQYFLELAREGRWGAFAREAKLCVEHLRRERGAYAMQETFRDPREVLNAYAGAQLKTWAAKGNYLRFFRAANQIHKHFGVPRRQLYRRLWRDLLRPASLARWRRQHREPSSASARVPNLVNPDLARRTRLGERLAESRTEERPAQTLREFQRRTLTSPHLAYSFEKFDHYAAAFGVEARHPFMDKRLVEFCLALPPTQSLQGGWTRAVMRRAMTGVVPDRIRTRVGKTSLEKPYEYLLLEKSQSTLSQVVERLDEAAGVLNVPYLKELYERRDRLSSTEVDALGLGMGLAFWLQKQSFGQQPSSCLQHKDSKKVHKDSS